jgi:Ras-related protein Rab-33B
MENNVPQLNSLETIPLEPATSSQQQVPFQSPPEEKQHTKLIEQPEQDQELNAISTIPKQVAATPAIPQQHRRIFKIIVIGDSNVGKTCLTFRFCGGKFLHRSEATIGVDFREKTIQIDNEAIKLQIWDTAGQERFRKSMISHYYRNVHAVLFVYDVTNLLTFENLSYWIEEYNRHCGNNGMSNNLIPKLLVGNKCDLESETKVNTNIATTFADMHQMPLFETSAKDDSRQDHVEAIFMTLALKLKNSKPFYVPNQMHRARVQSVDHNQSVTGHNISSISDNSSGCLC